jgi:hypothetical protein
VVAVLLALWAMAGAVVDARTAVLEPDDNGVLFTTVTYLLHGQIPITDFYEPYGIALGVPGVVPHLLGFDGADALRVAYGVFPALMLFLLTLFLWRRVGWKLAVLVGTVSICENVPRYAMGYVPVFGFGLMIDRLARRTSTGSLREIAECDARGLMACSAVLSLAGWARPDYADFAVVWAVILAAALRGRRRWTLPLITVGFALLPTFIVIVTGGATHLFWILRYLLTTYHAQRGSPVVWHLFTDRFSELVHFQFGQLGNPAWVNATYGVGGVVVIAAVCMLSTRRGRDRLFRSDPTLVLPLMIVICALVLYSQAAAFDGPYGQLGVPIFWAAGALLVRRLPGWVLGAVILILAYPLVIQSSPGGIIDGAKNPPPIGPPTVARLDIPNGGAPDYAALQGVWRELGLDGRPTVSVELRNDVTWGGDAIVGFLLNAPAAAWPLTYDPGLVNRADVEQGTVQQLCQNRAPVVQIDHDYPYPAGRPVYVGSRLLDEFLATDYYVRAHAGEYRILLPSTPRCVLPQSLSDASLARLRDNWIQRGGPAEAGAIAVLLMDRERAAGRPVDPVNASAAAMGGYVLTPSEIPTGSLGPALTALFNGPAHQSMTAAAAAHWPSDIEALAAQTAWVDNHAPGQPGQAAAGQAVVAMALRHPNWPQAISNLAAVEPPNAALIRALSSGAKGIVQFDQWRLNWYISQGQLNGEIEADLALIGDYVRTDDPLNAADAEFHMAGLKGLPPGCAQLLRQRAGQKPGIGLNAASGPAPTCNLPAFAHASL